MLIMTAQSTYTHTLTHPCTHTPHQLSVATVPLQRHQQDLMTQVYLSLHTSLGETEQVWLPEMDIRKLILPLSPGLCLQHPRPHNPYPTT